MIKAFDKGTIRFYLTAERPYTFFKANSFSPEVLDGNDIYVYPVSGMYTFGIKLTY